MTNSDEARVIRRRTAERLSALVGEPMRAGEAQAHRAEQARARRAAGRLVIAPLASVERAAAATDAEHAAAVAPTPAACAPT